MTNTMTASAQSNTIAASQALFVTRDATVTVQLTALDSAGTQALVFGTAAASPAQYQNFDAHSVTVLLVNAQNIRFRPNGGGGTDAQATFTLSAAQLDLMTAGHHVYCALFPDQGPAPTDAPEAVVDLGILNSP